MRLNGPFAISNLTARKAIADAAHTVGTTDTTIYTSYAYTSITASRIFTLCAANAVPAGFQLLVKDASGSCCSPGPTGTGIEIQIKPAGSDTVEGVAAATNFEVIRDARGSCLLESDGTSNWTIVAVTPHTRIERFIVAQTYTGGWRKPLTCSAVRVTAIGAGGGGGSGQHVSATSTAAGGGGGGGPGGYTDVTLAAADLAVTETVIVGAASSTASATRTSAGAGSAGNPGGSSSFSVGGTALVVGGGGGGGSGGASGGGGAGGNPGYGMGWLVDFWSVMSAFFNALPTGVGASGSAPAGAGLGYQQPQGHGPGGGGGGGGTSAAPAAQVGANGGYGSIGIGTAGLGATPGLTQAGADATNASPAITGVIASIITGGSGGGGAGGRTTSGQGHDGGNGSKYGGGGGGGANGITAPNRNGHGGLGADGAVLVISYR